MFEFVYQETNDTIKHVPGYMQLKFLEFIDLVTEAFEVVCTIVPHPHPF